MNKDIFVKSLESLLAGTDDNIAVLANSSAFIFEFLEDVNWVGFYLHNNDALKLGPFQGRPACVEIIMGKGVCGTSASQRKTITINDVTKVDNYIACHEETRSEIVIPVVVNDFLYGVLDIDSTTIGRFKDSDKELLEGLVEVIASNIKL